MSRCKFSVGKALTTASAAKPERTAKRENRIMIELRIGKLEISLSAWWTGAVISELSGACHAITIQWYMVMGACAVIKISVFASLRCGDRRGWISNT